MNYGPILRDELVPRFWDERCHFVNKTFSQDSTSGLDFIFYVIDNRWGNDFLSLRARLRVQEGAFVAESANRGSKIVFLK